MLHQLRWATVLTVVMAFVVVLPPTRATADEPSPSLLSYYPGPDDDCFGRWWVTDTTDGASELLTRFATPEGWQTHLAGDLDGDGTTALYSYFPGPDGNGHGRWWSTNTSTGAQELLTTFGTPEGWQSHRVADLDGDGAQELVSYFPGNGTWWRTSVGPDGRATQEHIATFGTRDGWQTHRVADMNGDGRQEILSYFPGNGSWWQTELLPDGTTAQTKVTTYGTATGWQEHLVANVTGDATPELLSFHAASGRWWQTDTSGDTPHQSVLTTYGDGDGLAGADWTDHLTIDADMDGVRELLSYDESSGDWWTTPTDGTSAQARELLTTYATRTGWQAHAFGRIDTPPAPTGGEDGTGRGCTTEMSPEEAIRSWFPEEGDKAVRVAECESGLNPRAVSPGGDFHGLFQVAVRYHREAFRDVTGVSWDEGIYVPYYNAQYARYLRDASDGWGPWPHCGKR